jgi:hypothetical protein
MKKSTLNDLTGGTLTYKGMRKSKLRTKDGEGDPKRFPRQQWSVGKSRK